MTLPVALLVDLDGTLVDTTLANYRAYSAALKTVGVTLDPKRWCAIGQGRNWRQFLPELVAHLPDVDPAEVAARKRALYPSMLSESRLNIGLVRRLRAVRQRVRVALVTTASRDNAIAAIHHHSLDDLFDVIVSGCDVEHHKPSPEAYHLAAAKLEVRAEQCLVFEDSAVGKAAATAFGARCLTVSLRPTSLH